MRTAKTAKKLVNAGHPRDSTKTRR